MKPIEMTAHGAVEHREALRAHFMRDGVLDGEERGLIRSAQGVYLRAETAAGFYRVGMRVLGGGVLDNQIAAQVSDLARLCDEHRAEMASDLGAETHKVA